ncbi:MAG: YdeI/OmpD-associated family protein [Candidatus Acidiferrales bacterium]
MDEYSYTIRFTPRRSRSIWSAINIKIARKLSAAGRMHATGLKAFEARVPNKSGIYSYEQRKISLPETYERVLRKNKAAWTFLQAQPPSYRKLANWWVASAKKEETRAKRLAKLIDYSARSRRL